MTEIEFIEKYVIVCDKDGNKSQIKLNDTQKRFLEYARKCNIKYPFTLQRGLYNSYGETNKLSTKRLSRRNRS